MTKQITRHLPTCARLLDVLLIAGLVVYVAVFAASSKKVTTNHVTPAAPFGENMYCTPGDIPTFGTNDGPALLPETCYYTDLSATPSPGNVTLVAVGQSVSNILSMAKCGDTVELAAGSSFAPFRVPAKNCDASHYITVRTSALDADMPLEGTRITPCYAGVLSLEGRPAYPCPTATNVMAKVTGETANTSAISFVSGANYYRFIGLEVTRDNNGSSVSKLINTNGANHIILDRMWIHGTSTDTTLRGISLDTSSYIAIVDSYLNDFHCQSTVPPCVDNRAIGAGSSATSQEGTWKIVNNYLEASAEDLAFGIPAAASTTAPTDVEIRHNYFYKPTFWMPGDPNYNGLSFIVRDHVELKNGTRILIEGNALQNTWGGFGAGYGVQQGPSILLSPRVNAAGFPCPLCVVTNITIRYNAASHLSQAFALTSPANTIEKFGSGNNNFSIHDDVFDDLNYPGCYQCSKIFTNALFGGTNNSVPPPNDVLQNVTVDHITEVASGVPIGMLSLGGTTAAFPPQESNITITNSIFNVGTSGFTNPGGGTANCAVVSSGAPLAMFDNCWSPYLFADNVVVGGNALTFKSLAWPPSTFLPSTTAEIGFVNLNGGLGGDYHLDSTSPYKGAGTDGQDIGANVDLVNSYTNGATTGVWSEN